MLHEFFDREWELYCRLGMDPFAWRQWYARYHRLPYREQCLIGYMLTVRRQLGELDEMLGAAQDIRLPFPEQHRYPVNNGLGVAYPIRIACFPRPDVWLCYVRNDMTKGPDETEPPEWVRKLSNAILRASQGLSEVGIEILPFAFDEGLPCSHWAVTFQPKGPDPILVLEDVTGEYEACLGEVREDTIIPLEYISIYYK
ncbi:MAG: hypothetical protein IKY34_05715 [Ruminiclostridium sp.]|nr:hypothetical protein [Ruminiclostridium sp.]